MRAIDGDILEKKLKDAINMCMSIDTSGLSELKAVLEDVEKMPTIEPQRKKGRWKRVSADEYTQSAIYVYRCDKCEKCNFGMSNFCPNCGAEMTEGEG